jgi:Resolvase, N terminal domain
VELDRLGRSLRHLADTVTGLADRGIGFRSLQESIDTTTPGGKLVFHVFAALAEFEPSVTGIWLPLVPGRGRLQCSGRPCEGPNRLVGWSSTGPSSVAALV